MAARVIRIEIPIETQDKTDPALGKVTAKMEELDSSSKKVKRGFEEALSSAKGFEKSLGNSMDKASQKTKGFEKSLDSVTKENWRIIMELKDKVTPEVRQIIIFMKNLTNKTWKVTMKAVDLVTSPVKRVFGLLKSPLVAAGVTISAGAGITSTINTYADFEAAMSNVKAISGATANEFAALTEKAKQMGAVTKFTASESAEAFTYMAQAGWNAKDMIEGIDGLMSLSAASGESLGLTSDIVTDALTAFNMPAKESGRFADVMAQASNATNTNVAKMGETFKYVAPVAGALGYTIEDTAVAIGLMANSGIKASQAGTSLRSLLTNLTHPVGQAKDAIEALDLSITNADGSVKPLSQTMEELRSKFLALSEAERTQYAAMLAGQEGMSGLLAIVNSSDADFRKLTEEINNSSGAAKRMSEIMMDNLAGKYELFTGSIDSLKMALGERFKPYLVEALEWLTDKMPDIEDALLSGMNRFDAFVDRTKEKIAEFTSTDEWQNADMFGKIGIAWDELIAEPFSDWWNGNGQLMIADAAHSIGKGVGMGISAGLNGILALLGIETDSVINEGSAIGKQFAQGFSEGLQGTNILASIGKIFTGAFSMIVPSMLSSAGKLLPGGESPGIMSFLSAAMLANASGKLVSIGGKAIGAGKKILDYKDVILGSAATGKGLKGLGASAGMIGLKLGSGATSGAGLIAAGAGGVAGGVVGGVTLISGGIDAYNAYKSYKEGDKEKAKAYGTSAGLTVGGAATGAAIGTAILPGVGTLVGLGIGGLAGWLGGNRVKEDYEQAAEAAELLAEKSKYALEGAKFDSKELGKAFKDTNVSAEEFGLMMQEATSNKIKDSFGDIKLSVQEIKDAAEKIVFGENLSNITKFSDAATIAERSFGNLQNSISSMEKLNWKASLGKLDETEIEEYKTTLDSMVENSIQYLEDKHYEATTAIRLLVAPDNEIDMFSGLDSVYKSMQEKINDLSGQLTAKVDVALEDGVISLDEQAEISNLQKQITEITNKVSQAETEASFQAVKIKYSGADLDADSFANLMEELKMQAQSAADNYLDSLEVSLSGVYLQLEDAKANLEAGDISIEDYTAIQESIQKQIDTLGSGYNANISEISVNVESFALQSIEDAFGKELDGILPNLEGTVAQRLGTAMHNAMANGVNVESWDVSTATKWLDLDGLSAETQSAITEMISQVAASMPEQMTSALENSGTDMSASVNNMLKNGIENADLSETGSTLTKKLGESMSSVDMSDAGSGLQEGLQNSLTSSIENIDLTDAGMVMNQKLGESIASIDMSESGTGLQEGLKSSLVGAIDSMDFTEISTALNTNLGTALTSVENVDVSGFVTAVQTSLDTSVQGLTYTSVTTAVGNGVSEAIAATMPSIQTAIDTLYSNVGSAINAAFSAGFSTTTTVTITVNYKLANPSATISFSGGGSGTATVSGSIASNANGSFSNGPELTWWGEDGPEVIIPLGSKRRSRGLDLWAKAGEILGVPMHANGGITGASEGGASYFDYVTNNVLQEIPDYEETEVPVSVVAKEGTNSKNDVTLNLTVNPQFVISGQSDKSDDDVIRIIKRHMKELADDLGGELAERLGEVFSNMPVKA